MTLIPYRHGRPVLWDATVRCTVAETYIGRTALRAGAAAAEAEARKRRKYAVFAGDYEVVPLAFESHGSLGPTTDDFFADLTKRIRFETGDNRAGSFFMQQLSIALQRGNALCVQAAMGCVAADGAEAPATQRG